MPPRGYVCPLQPKTCARCSQDFMGKPQARVCNPCREEKERTRRLTAHAIRAGKLARQPCQACDHEDTHAHHETYDNPMEVVWLCPDCHVMRHSNLRYSNPTPLGIWLVKRRAYCRRRPIELLALSITQTIAQAGRA